jgi:RNA polymerase sigma factor (sigma-70 family)
LNPHEFNEFYRRETASVVSLLIRCGYRPDDAADATQDAMWDAFVNWTNLQSPAAWVRTVALRKAMKYARASDRERQSMIKSWWLIVGHDGVDRTAVVEGRDGILALLSALPAQQRKVVALRLDGFGVGEIADILAIDSSSVRSHLRHVRSRIATDPSLLGTITGIEV